MISHHLGKCSNLIFLYFIGYNNTLRRSHDYPNPKLWGSLPPVYRIDALAIRIQLRSNASPLAECIFPSAQEILNDPLVHKTPVCNSGISS